MVLEMAEERASLGTGLGEPGLVEDWWSPRATG